jgi:alpha-beta hydrolase superfamily lysophospholipase
VTPASGPPSRAAALIGKWRSVLPGRREEAPEPAASVCQPPAEPGWWSDSWVPDAYLPGFECLTFHMPGCPHLPEEGPGHLTATLVRRGPARRPHAVLYIHGWNEYFFQDHLAAAWERLGYDFYAIDLHRYGRSLHGEELPGYIASVTDYDGELDAAVDLIAQDHPHIVLNGHSTGGLTAALWAAGRPGRLVGLALNSPWLDLQGSLTTRTLVPPLAKGLSTTAPTMELPRVENDIYIRSLHRAFSGEWSFDLALKRPASTPLRPGWLGAIVRAQDRVARGLAIDVPILAVLSARSTVPKQRDEPDVSRTDTVLDVDRVAARLPKLGWHVTLVRLDGALHDVCLSAAPVRDRYFDELRRWDLAYVKGAAS